MYTTLIKKIVLSVVTILCVFNSYSQTIGPWNVTQLKQVPNWQTSNVDAVSGMTGILYESIDYLGNQVEVFAYYSAPAGTPPAGGWPAAIFAHGGGGTAFPQAVTYWNSHGYAAISMDLEGQYPNNSQTPNPGPSRVGVWDDYTLPIEEQWYYHAIAQVLKAHSLIASFPEVNPNKIGVMGASWGGTITSTVMGVDDRLAWALPVYGGGFLSQSDGHQGDAISAAEANFINIHYDGSAYFDNVTFPTLWLNGTNDFHFSLSCNQLSSREVQGPTTLMYIQGFAHGNLTWRQRDEVYTFANSVVNGGDPLAEVGIPYIASNTGYVTASSVVGLSSAQLFYSNDGDNVDLNDKTWLSTSANISGNTISASIPSSAEIIFFAVTDSRGLTVTSEYLLTSNVTPLPSGNLALSGTASQSTTAFGGDASRAIDGDTNGAWSGGSVTHTEAITNSYWQVDLGSDYTLGDINVFNRTDACCDDRLSDFTVIVIDEAGSYNFIQSISTIPSPSVTVDAGGVTGKIIRIRSNAINTPLSLAEVQVFAESVSGMFVPDPSKTYYIDCPVWDLRLASSGASEDAYTTSTSTTGADVEWKFVDKGNGYWHMDRAAGGTKPRLRTDGTANADMNQIAANGVNTYYDFTEGASSGTYFLTLPDGAANFNRLQIDNTGDVKMTGISSTGSWESFTITEASTGTRLVSDIPAADKEVSGLNIYPNPVLDSVTINIGESKAARVDVINKVGQVVFSRKIEGGSTSIDLAHISQGLYIIKVTDGLQVQTKEILKR